MKHVLKDSDELLTRLSAAIQDEQEIIIDVTKVQIKTEKPTSFGELFSMT